MERPTVKKVVTKLSTVRYHSQYVASLKQEREKVQQEIVQLKEKLKSKEEFALKENQESRKQLGTAKWEIAQLKEKLKSNKELALKEIQESQKQVGIAKRKIAQLKEKLEEKLQERDKQIQACEMEIKTLLQQSQKKDMKISELEAWKKTTKDKLLSLASVAEL